MGANQVDKARYEYLCNWREEQGNFFYQDECTFKSQPCSVHDQGRETLGIQDLKHDGLGGRHTSRFNDF